MSNLVLGAAPVPLTNIHTILGADIRPGMVIADTNVIGLAVAGEQGGVFHLCLDVRGAPFSSYKIDPAATYFLHGGKVTFTQN